MWQSWVEIKNYSVAFSRLHYHVRSAIVHNFS